MTDTPDHPTTRTGPEHYQQAARILWEVRTLHQRGSAHHLGVIAEAQVHATLALAAALGLGAGLPTAGSASGAGCRSGNASG